ncbi:MAG: hypothetical protein IPO91_29545 [Chloroflexi bacterium]|nr:hypothetical protein [Chloroflexota bacterium]
MTSMLRRNLRVKAQPFPPLTGDLQCNPWLRLEVNRHPFAKTTNEQGAERRHETGKLINIQLEQNEKLASLYAEKQNSAQDFQLSLT